MIELRRENPIVLKALNNQGELLIGAKEQIVSNNGAVFSENHYGFDFTTLENGMINHETQCPIFGVEVEDGLLKVFEDGKFIPWKIDIKSGDVIECAKFLNISRRDIAYLESKFGLGIEDLEKVNSYLDSEELKRNI